MRGIAVLFLLGLQPFALANQEVHGLALGSPKLSHFDELIQRNDDARFSNLSPSKVIARDESGEGESGEGSESG